MENSTNTTNSARDSLENNILLCNNLNKILFRCERMVDGIYFEIVAQPRKIGKEERCLVEPEADASELMCNLNKNVETFKDRLDRIKKLQENYRKLWKRATDKLQQFQEKYKYKNYKIILFKQKAKLKVELEVKSNSQSEIPSDPDSEQSFSGYSSASTVSIGKRKASCSDDSGKEEETLNKRYCDKKYPRFVDSSSDLLIIGPNGTRVDRKEFEAIQWEDAAVATRKLLTIVFGDKVLATHTLTGNQSPAFRGRERPPKEHLGPNKTADIIYLISLKCKVNNQVVRAAITTKCADASKKFR